MSDPKFDSYYKWLGISPADQPANHYRLLGVDQFESDADVIESAAQRQIAHVRTFALGNYAEASQALLNELSSARVTLLNPDRKKEYDKRLKAELQSNVPSIDQGSGESRQQRALVEVAIEPVPGRKSVSSRRVSVSSRKKKVPLGVIGLVVVILGLVLTFLLYRSFSGGDNRVAVTNEKVSSEATAKQGIAAEKESPPDRKELPANEKSAGPAPVASVDPEPSESTPIASTGTPEPSGSDAAAVMSGVVGDPPPPAIAPFDAAQAKAHQQAWADHLAVPVRSTNSIGMRLVVIPPGEFLMGSPDDEHGRVDNETLHIVTLSQPFWMGMHEVTQEQFERVTGTNPSHFNGTQNPVDTVSWSEAVKFCRELSELPEEKEAGHVYRLPTEAEWECACRAGATTAYSFGDSHAQLGEHAWYAWNSNRTTHPVGRKQPNPWNLYDMHGNVWEKCQDRYGAYTSSEVTDPTGPLSGSRRVSRGGCFSDGAGSNFNRCRTAFRGSVAGDDGKGKYVGFRVLRSTIKPVHVGLRH